MKLRSRDRESDAEAAAGADRWTATSGRRRLPSVSSTRLEPAEITIDHATPSEVPAIAALLRTAGLPHEDFAPHLAHFHVARDGGGAVVGAIGTEVYGGDALLRSLVVAPEARGRGLGDRLVRALEAAAATWGVRRWWLLTTTAETFFKKRGFVATPRAAAPAAIAATEEFRGLCPSVAVCLSRERQDE